MNPGSDMRPTPIAERHLEGKVCLIAGAGSLRGIGVAAATLFARHGAKLVLVDLAMSDKLVSEISTAIQAHTGVEPEVIGLPCDIQDADACRSVVAEAVRSFGALDVLVNTAGVVKSDGLLSISAKDLSFVIDVNLKGAFNLAQSVLEVFVTKGQGAIVNVASVAAQRGGGLVGGAHYAASKGGVISLTRSIAREFGPKGIRANAICPSMTDTGMLDGNLTQAQYDAIVETIPLKRAGKPEDIANACLFLASNLSAYVTGATLDVNGGSHIH
jgi:NAD(P)-dependent dehydrogenase (short-subunit alcohol dehydrogenase family)